jgi:hypothetical protein
MSPDVYTRCRTARPAGHKSPPGGQCSQRGDVIVSGRSPPEHPSFMGDGRHIRIAAWRRASLEVALEATETVSGETCGAGGSCSGLAQLRRDLPITRVVRPCGRWDEKRVRPRSAPPPSWQKGRVTLLSTSSIFDLICLSRSPSFTPAAADAVYDEIRSRFIDENALARDTAPASDELGAQHGRRRFSPRDSAGSRAAPGADHSDDGSPFHVS